MSHNPYLINPSPYTDRVGGLPLGGFVPASGSIRGRKFTSRADAEGNALWSGGIAYKLHSPLCPLAHGGGGDGRCWKYGCIPFRGFRVACVPTINRFGVASAQAAGATISVQVGEAGFSGDGDRRDAVLVGPGCPVFCAGGDYESVRVLVTRMTDNCDLSLQWTDDAIPMGAGAGAASWRSPLITPVIPAIQNDVPNGAIEVFAETATTLTWRLQPGVDSPDILAAGQTARTRGSRYQSSNGANLQFFLQPL